jgi:hypothetical protein
MASPNNIHSQELQPYIGEDTFDAFIDLDFLRNNHNSMDEDVDIGAMSNSDLFRYFLEGELVKAPEAIDIEQPSNTFPAPMQDVSHDFTLMPSAVINTEDMKISPMTPPAAVSPVTPTADLIDLPQQTLGNSTVVPSLAVLNAQLAELLAKLPLIKQEPVDNKITTTTLTSKLSSTQSVIIPKHNGATSSHSGDSVTSPTSPGPNEITPPLDLKKLTSKERRQLRNKISARNFRVRRKEYISNLESTNQQQLEEINLLRQALLHIQEENSKLKEEVEELHKQQKQTSKVFVTSPPSPPHVPSKESSGVTLAALSKNNNGNSRSNSIKNPVAHPHQPPTSPANRYLVIPNVNKDTPASPSQTQKTWSDSRVRVQTTFVPEFSLDKHSFQDKFENNTFGHWSNSPLTMFMDKDGQQMWLAYMLVATLMQQMSALFVQAVCAIPQSEMIASLYPNNTLTFNQLQSTPEISAEELEPAASIISIEPAGDIQESTLNAPPPPSSTLDNTTLVENALEASVLDWLYDTMVRHVVEQSQVEARMHELQSDWVGDEFEDNVLPLLF